MFHDVSYLMWSKYIYIYIFIYLFISLQFVNKKETKPLPPHLLRGDQTSHADASAAHGIVQRRGVAQNAGLHVVVGSWRLNSMADVYRKGPTRSPVSVLVYNPMQTARSHRHAVGSGTGVFQLGTPAFFFLWNSSEMWDNVSPWRFLRHCQLNIQPQSQVLIFFDVLSLDLISDGTYFFISCHALSSVYLSETSKSEMEITSGSATT